MGALQMDSEALHNLGGEIVGRSETLGSLAATFNTTTQSMTEPEVWAGVDATTLRSAAERFKADLDKAVTLVGEIGEGLGGTATAYDDTFDTVSSNLKNL